VIPAFDTLGRLPPGIHDATWDELCDRFSGSRWRDRLLAGLREALTSLKLAGCKVVYIDGSFVTAKPIPGDFDCCWDERHVDPDKLDPVLLDFSNRRAKQKEKFGGELFPACSPADSKGTTFVDFFQIEKVTGDRKGIIAINLERWQP
jgi:hypothetical protein